MDPCAHAESLDYDDSDTREWTREHLEAANIPNPSIVALTPPRGDDTLESRDVDVRGPGGFTPLMLASYCGSTGLDTGLDSESSGSGEAEGTSAITDLLHQGAAINAQTDRTGTVIMTALNSLLNIIVVIKNTIVALLIWPIYILS